MGILNPDKRSLREWSKAGELFGRLALNPRVQFRRKLGAGSSESGSDDLSSCDGNGAEATRLSYSPYRASAR